MSDFSVAGALAKGRELILEQTELRKRTTANRKFLTLLVENGLATSEEAEEVKKMYPPHKAKSAPDASSDGETAGPSESETPAPKKAPKASASED